MMSRQRTSMVKDGMVVKRQSGRLMGSMKKIVTSGSFSLALLIVGFSLFAGGQPSAAAVTPAVFHDLIAGSNQEAVAMKVDSAGNLIITGYTGAFGTMDYYTIKVTADGQTMLWPGGVIYNNAVGNAEDWPVAVTVDAADDVFVTGYSFNGSNYDIVTIKYRGSDGSVVWTHTYEGDPQAGDYPYTDDFPLSMAVQGDSLYVAGYSNHGVSGTGDDAVLFKLPSGDSLNGDGQPTWLRTYNDPLVNGDERFNWVSAGVGGVAVTGFGALTDHGGTTVDSYDYLTMKYDETGALLWKAVYDHGIGEDIAKKVMIDGAGNVLVTGKVMDNNHFHTRTVKYAAAADVNGDAVEEWAALYQGDQGADQQNVPFGFVVDANGDAFVAGYCITAAGLEDFMTLRYAAADGTKKWDDIYDSGLNNRDIALDLDVNNLGGVFVTGYTSKAGGDDDFLTIKYHSGTGNRLWVDMHDSPAGGDDHPSGLAVDVSVGPGGSVYVGGWSDQGTAGSADLDYYALIYDAGLLDTPTGLLAQFVADQPQGIFEVQLQWDDNSNNEDRFCVDRCEGFDCSLFVEIGCTAAANSVSFADTTIQQDTWYSYMVRAQADAIGDSLDSNRVDILTTKIDFPAPSWLYVYDGEGLDDQANDIVVDSEDNPIATGMVATVAGQDDIYTVKLDRGNPLVPKWFDDYDGQDGQGDNGVSLTVDADDNVLVTGFSTVSNAGVNTEDFFTIKYDKGGPDIYTGEPLWVDLFNAPGNAQDRSKAVAAAMDGSNYSAVVGFGENTNANDDIYVIKYKAEYAGFGGDQRIWTVAYDGGFDDTPTAVAFDAAGDVVVVGESYHSLTDKDIFVGKYAGADGAAVFPEFIYDSLSGNDRINDVVVDSLGNIYVAGYVTNSSGNLDWYINKIDAAGNRPWGDAGVTIDGAFHSYDEAKVVALDPNNGEVVVAGTLTAASGSQDMHVVRLSTDGIVLRQITLDRVAQDEELVDMGLSPSGDIALVGLTDNGVDSDVVAVRYNYQGVLIGSTLRDSGYDDFATAMAGNRLGEFFVAGYSTTGSLAIDDYDFVVFKLEGNVLQAPSPLQATSHHTSVDLSWRENDPSADSYSIFRRDGACQSGGTSFGPSDLLYAAGQAEVSYLDAVGLSIGSVYCYGIQAHRSADGADSVIIESQAQTTVPQGPDTLVVTPLNSSEIEVCWHDNTATEDKFVLQRCTGAGCDFVSMNFPVTSLDLPPETDGTAVQTCYIDSNACDMGDGTVFRYRVQAVKLGHSGINEGWSTAFTPSSSDQSPLGFPKPSDLTVTRISEAEVLVEWTDNTNDEDDFVIERCSGAGCVNHFERASVSSVSGNALLLEMDEASWNGTAGEVLDSSGNGRHGTAVAGPYPTVDAERGSSAYFDGGNDWITTPLVIDQSTLSVGATMMAWVKPASTSGTYRFVMSTEDGTTTTQNHNWGVAQQTSSNTWAVETGEAVRSTGVTVDVGQWQHVAVVYSPSGIKFYKNGLETPLNYIGFHDQSSELTIGRRGILSQYYFNGLIDEAAVYDRPLSYAEIQKIFQRGIFPEVSGHKWFRDTSVSFDSVYSYKVAARKDTPCVTQMAYGDSAVETTTTVLPPDNLQISVDGSELLQVSWQPQSVTQTGFQLERCLGAGCVDFSVVTASIDPNAGIVDDASFCLGSDRVVRYRLKALGAWGESTASAIVETTVPLPPPPTGLSAVRVSEALVDLRWDYGTNDRDSFVVMRCDGLEADCDQGIVPFTEISPADFLGLPTGVTARYEMESGPFTGAVGDVGDSSVNGNHATSHNGLVASLPGRFGDASASFDGVDDYIDTGLVFDQSASGPGLTVETWVKPVKESVYRHIFSTYSGTLYGWGISVYGNTLYLSTGYSLRVNIGAPVLPENAWSHLLVTFEPGQGVTVYVNGTPYHSYQLGYPAGAAVGNLVLGRYGAASSEYFKGEMDEVVVYSRALTPQEGQDRANGLYHYQDSTVQLNSPYTYRITPHRLSGCAVPADWDSHAQSAAIFQQTPVLVFAPGDFTATELETTKVALSWTDLADSESEYRLERCAGTGVDCTDLLQSLGPDSTSYADTTVCPDSSYTYWLTTVTPQGNSRVSAVVVTSPAPAPILATAVVSESEVDLTWPDTMDEEDSFELSRCLYEAGVTECDADGQFSLLQNFPSTNGIRLHYRMDELLWNGTAGQVIDQTGNYNGTALSGAVTVAAGRFDRGGSFDGANDAIQTLLSIDQTVDAPGVTMAAWVKPTLSDSNQRTVFGTSQSSSAFGWGFFNKNGFWYVYDGLTYQTTGVVAELNEWHHLAMTVDPLVGIKIFKDGTEVFSEPFQLDLRMDAFFDSAAGQLFIGRNGIVASSLFQGFIDEALVLDHPATEAEIAAYASPVFRSGDFGYSDSGLSADSTYYYKLKALKGGACGWPTEDVQGVVTPPPAPPANLLLSCDSTSCSLHWDDMNGSETSYMVGRCPDSNYSCATPQAFPLSADSQDFVDETVCQGQPYSYRVWAVGPWGESSFIQDNATTLTMLPAPSAILANKVSEVETVVDWTFSSVDESVVKLKRCQTGGGCDELQLAPGTGSFIDNELQPDKEYCYEVALAKDAPNACDGAGGWQTTWTGPSCISTDPLTIADLLATPLDTTTVQLDWSEGLATETAINIERCVGDLATCASGPFVKVGTATREMVTYTDQISPPPAACFNQAYTYQLQAVGDGLSLGGGGCWSKRVAVNFNQFTPFSAVVVSLTNIAANFPEMRADLADIRFYDETAHRELPLYWIQDKVDGVSGSVWLMTGANQNISLYYGNALATDASAGPDGFMKVYDDFQGTVIDSSKWDEVDSARDKLSQNNGLIVKGYDYTGSTYNTWDASLLSTMTYERAAGNEVLIDFTTGGDNYIRYDFMGMGWGLDQSAYATTDKLVYGFYMYGYYEKWQPLPLLAGSIKTASPSVQYLPNTHYEIKIVLNAAGADYFMRGGTLTDWTRLYTTATVQPTDQVMRLAVLAFNHNMVIHAVKVRAATDIAVSGLGIPESPGGGGCWAFSHTWAGAYSNKATATTDDIFVPQNLTVDGVVDGAISLSWQDPDNTDESGYQIERCCGSGCSYAVIDTVGPDLMTYVDVAAPLESSCSYQVRAFKNGSCPWVSDPSVPTALADTATPAPSNFEAIPENAFQVKLTWDAVSGAEGYEIETQIFNGAWMPVTTLSIAVGNEIYYDSRGINPNTAYTYRIRAYRGAAFSAYAVTGTTTPTPDFDSSASTCVP